MHRGVGRSSRVAWTIAAHVYTYIPGARRRSRSRRRAAVPVGPNSWAPGAKINVLVWVGRWVGW